MPLQATSGAASYDAFGGGVPVVPAYIEEVFATHLYTGNGSTQTITNGIDLSTKGGMVWIKSRDNTNGHRLTDTSRGVTKSLESNSTNAEATESTGLTAFNTTGFTIGADADYNANAYNFSSWTFRKQPKFFDVVTYTGNGQSTARGISHNLGSRPGCIIVKRTDSTGDWWVAFDADGGGTYLTKLKLNSTQASTGSTGLVHSSTSFTCNLIDDPSSYDVSVTNTNGATYVAYLFAHNAGGFGLTGTDNVISCGSFTTDANGQASVTLGYEPQWLLWKNTSAVENWVCVDNMRGLSRTEYKGLRPNLTSGTEFSNTVADALFPTATGFATGNGTASAFKESNTYIYIAIRRGPMKVPTSGTSVYKGLTRTGTGATATVTGVGFSPDLIFNMCRNTAGNYITVRDRLRGTGSGGLATNQGAGEPDFAASLSSINMDGITYNSSGIDNDSGFTFVNQFFRRAPSFFDEVCYTGTGANTTFAHNLGAVPELMLVKRRNTGGAWDSYSSALANTEYIVLNTTAAKATGTTRWNSTTPTSSVFSVGTSTTVNASGGTYVAYLFATCAGVSKVGSYTGTATTKQIDCGFTGGARFVVIKRTDSTGDWYVWDSARGIVSGDDPYLLFNSTAEEVTNTDYIDTYSAGFEISSTAPAAINANGGSFIFLAIA